MDELEVMPSDEGSEKVVSEAASEVDYVCNLLLDMREGSKEVEVADAVEAGEIIRDLFPQYKNWDTEKIHNGMDVLGYGGLPYPEPEEPPEEVDDGLYFKERVIIPILAKHGLGEVNVEQVSAKVQEMKFARAKARGL